MRISDFYRGLLRLYPGDFHQQFSEEMLSVFEQRVVERIANRGSVSIAFVLAEFTGIAKGACTMWMTKILPIRRNTSQPRTAQSCPATPAPEPLTIAEATRQHNAAIRNMVAAIAGHDFPKARQHSYEEIRLKNLLKELQSKIPAGHSETLAN
ncbi:MAG TPA: hypothetical protein VGM02_06535 [Acidobacteriaceae bacterium]|jgi:hypothetical protein